MSKVNKMSNVFTNDNTETKFNILLKALPTKGNIAWEYNPFRNYRLDEDLYEYDGYYYTLALLILKFDICLNIKVAASERSNTQSTSEILIEWDLDKADIVRDKANKANYSKVLDYSIRRADLSNDKFTIDDATRALIVAAFEPGLNWNRETLITAIHEYSKDNPNGLEWVGVSDTKTDPQLREKGELVDFITDELEFDINHPVDIIAQNSYDDSVNLIMNDGISYPKLINSRFSPRGRNTYEIVDIKGNSDTNIYDRGELFKTDTSLYKLINTFPKLKLLSISNGGSLKVGNYFFYFKLADSDGNETDFFEESGLVSIFKGGSTYSSTSTGERDENSFKLVTFLLTNLDTAYLYVMVYYSRASSEADFNKAIMYYKIDLKYIIKGNGISTVHITGFEPVDRITNLDINIMYSLVDSAETQASCLNRLFLGNIKKPKIEYEELADLSLRFIPQAATEEYDVNISKGYSIQSSNKGYIDPMYIYNKTGYWNKELYRFGIVYIMKNGELSPVFDIRGAYNINKDIEFSDIPIYDKENERKYIEYDEGSYKIINLENPSKNAIYENVKGVCRLDINQENGLIHYFQITTTPDVIEELKKHVKGFFFVRLSRMPTILAQGITIGIDLYGRVPTIPVDGSNCKVLNQMATDLIDKTHVEVDDLNGLNYISEGFMSRYKFYFKEHSSSVWKKIGIIFTTVVAVAAAVVISVLSMGTLSAAGIAIAGLSISWATAGIVAGCVLGGAVLIPALVAGVLEAAYAVNRIGATKEYKGRKTKAPGGYEIRERDESRRLVNTFSDRIIIKSKNVNDVSAIICPEFSVKLYYYNSIFCGNECYLESAIALPALINRTPTKDGVNPEENAEIYSFRAFNNLGGRLFYIESYGDQSTINHTISKIVALTDGQSSVSIDDLLFKAKAGDPEEAWRVIAISDLHLKNKDNESDSLNNEWRKINGDYVRGIYGPYLAMEPTTVFTPAEIVNIYVPGYDPTQSESYVKIRCNDASPYRAITNRINISDLSEYQPTKSNLVDDSTEHKYEFPIFRGDCYICKYTHRFNRNFNDPSTPYNDIVIDEKCWKEGFDPSDPTKYEKINTSDVNAILLGMWLTFDVRATRNLNVLTIDSSNVEEKAMSGHARGHYPLLPMSVEGSYKIADSAVYNSGMEVNLSEKNHFLEADVPYIKQWYGTRIMYSNIYNVDSFKNGYRLFWSTNHLDYPVDYGSITKLINWRGSLLCIFEHGIALIPVNERSVAGLGAGGNVYINTNRVLPDNPNMLSDKFGSLWKDSILDTPNAVYGVDTVAKKIWRTDGTKLELISDFSVQEFLNNHISLSERELEPILGIRNVKTHYNAFKLDVMFTFYDDKYGFEEEAWNLCYNETLGKWITFYSWIPSFSNNIYNQYFSFDRNTSKIIAKLGICKEGSDFADGIILSSNIVTKEDKSTITINDKQIEALLIGTLSIENRSLPSGDGVTTICNFEIVRDVWGNYKNFVINGDKLYYIGEDSFSKEMYLRVFTDSEHHQWLLKDPRSKEQYPIALSVDDKGKPIEWKKEETCYDIYTTLPTTIYKEKGVRLEIEGNTISPNDLVIYLNIKANIRIEVEEKSKTLAEAMTNGFKNLVSMDAGYFQSTIAITHEHNLELLTTDFWKHGLSGIIDITDPIKPTTWYGVRHPFEFEFVVKDNPQLHKIFDNLEIISNKAAPESFHYEVVGECYDFANNKKNMYIRQEATKELYQYNGSNITFDHDWKKLGADPGNVINGTNFYPKSTIMPLYYTRLDKIDEIKDTYKNISELNNSVLQSYYKDNNSKDFNYLAGGEIIHYKNLDEYRICNHVKAVDVNTTREFDWTRGNMTYKEDKWNIQITPLNYVLHNESVDDWGENKKISINPYIFELPNDVLSNNLNIPFNLDGHKYIEWEDEATVYQEAKLKDKYIKIKIRYSGEDLAVILAINTLYSISYA